MDVATVGGSPTDHEIRQVYERLGLLSASDRARFDRFAGARPQVTFDVVISTSSQPFRA